MPIRHLATPLSGFFLVGFADTLISSFGGKYSSDKIKSSRLWTKISLNPIFPLPQDFLYF
jgi:hypothetical protein